MKTTRRNFLKSAGILTIGFSTGMPDDCSWQAPPGDLPESLRRHPNINAWLEVLEDGRLRVFTGKLELGQGIRTAIAQVAAEELDMDVKNVEVILADTGRTPDEGYTAGSGSMEQSAMAVRYAAAAAREKLTKMAAEKYRVNLQNIRLNNGNVYTNNEKRGTVADLLAGKQITDTVSAPVALKQKKDYVLVGTPVKRDDITRMVKGEYQYVHDLRFPGMVHARVVRPPVYEASLETYDEEYVRRESSANVIITRNGDFIAVVSPDEFVAVKAEKALRLSAKWKYDPIPSEAVKNMKGYLKSLPSKAETVHTSGSSLKSAFQHKATYYKPYLMHGSTGPSCAVALYKNDVLHIWSHSQGVFPLRGAIAEMLKIKEERIRISGVPGAGCYGHNGADDVAAEAALIAVKNPGKHIRLQWSREDEHGWEPYGSAMIMELAANLDDRGNIIEWKHELWSDNHSTRPGNKAANLLPSRYIDNKFEAPSGGYSGGAWRNSQPYYSIPNQEVVANIVKAPLRVSALRSLGAYANVFAIESFIDELSIAAGVDPFEFRLRHQQDPRAIAVIKKLRQMIADEKPKTNEGIGIAFSRYKNSAAYCAVAAKMFVNKKENIIRVLKMWAAIDAGEIINPDGLINQTEGGLIQSASWTLLEQVSFDEQRVTSTDWSSYPIMRFEDIPDVHVEIIPMPAEEVLGAGEAAQGPAAAAIVNGIFRASGMRIRELPAIRVTSK